MIEMNEVKERISVLDERIVSFMQSQSNLTLAVSESNIPYCANCFYTWSEKENSLIIKSKRETNHIRVALKNKSVAGTIVPDALNKTRIQGIQFTGVISKPDGALLNAAENIYYNKYPYAKVVSGEIWMIELWAIKFTDNHMGFGKRLEWKISGDNY
jgi:uncharacterized protein YhbP (UPF0306 family)